MNKQAGGHAACRRRHQRREKFVPQRHIIIAVQGLRKDQRRRHRCAEHRADGAGSREDRPVKRMDARKQLASQRYRQGNVDRHNGVFRAKADAARQTDDHRQRQAG